MFFIAMASYLLVTKIALGLAAFIACAATLRALFRRL